MAGRGEVVDTPLPRWSEVDIARQRVTGSLLAMGLPVGCPKARLFAVATAGGRHRGACPR